MVNEDGPRMNTNEHEDRWTSFAATASWDEAPRERGRPARTMPGRAPAIAATWIERQRRRGIDFFMNMDAQDAQDKQDERLLHGKPARAMIGCGLADAQDCKPAVS